MKTVKEILNAKGHDFFSVSPADTVYDAIRIMADNEIGSVLVMDGGRLVGIVTERDYARKIMLEGKSSPNTPVRDIMTTNVLITAPDQSVDACMALVTEKRVRHLPVVADEQVAGVVSIGDLVKAVIDEQKFIIEQLESYIAG